MFTAAALGQHFNIVSGLHNVAIGRNQGYRSAKRGAGPGQEVLNTAARRLERLSETERQMLSSQTTQILNGMLGLEKSNIKSQQFDWDAVFQSAVDSIKEGHISCSGDQKKLLFSDNFLRAPSPLLINTRGFKTRRDGKTENDKPFVKQNKSGGSEITEESFKDVLKQLNISPAEKEKVNIALSMAAASGGGRGASQARESSETDEKSEKKRKWKLGDGRASGTFWGYASRLATILVIIGCLMGIAQFTGMIGFSLSKRANEIAPEDIEVNFDDVRGCDEAKRELQDVVEFLMNPDKFGALGGKLPKGVLLVGPPGTGKTLLARAVAGQAGVPFFHSSGSEFDEVLVGQGARRVRDLFKAAKERAPCVIFIDEIDSVGGKRTSSSLHPYANQTINQLLSEMDGFLCNEGVIVLGATNRSSDLDKALLRPGRFDTQVEVNNPDKKGRTEILHLYLGKIKHDNSINVETLASKTIGFSGADLQNLVNTAAIRAAVEGKEWVSNSDFDYAFDKVTIGVDLKSRIRSKEDLTITAYHEAGHTLVAYFTPDAMPLHKVTIVAKGGSGGHTAFIPSENMEWHMTKNQYKARIDTSMGGRAAEELIFGKEKITGGASSDLESATNTSTMMMIDAEIKGTLDDSYKRAMNILVTHKNELHMLAEALLKYETLDADDIKSIVEHKKPPTSKLSPPSTILGLRPGLGQPLAPVSGLSGLGVAPPPIESLGSRTESGPVSS